MAHAAHENPQPGARILIVDDETNARQTLKMLLEDCGHVVRDAADGFKALGVIREGFEPELVLTDLRMPIMDGLTLLQKLKALMPGLPCIVMTAFASVETAINAMKQGADDYLMKPLDFEAVELVIGRVLERGRLRQEVTVLRQQVAAQDSARRDIIGHSPPIQELLAMIDQIATARATVMITGESGTGKELIARRLHARSQRSKRPFVAVHCAALSESLLESELFGHERGAFTGASGQRKGRFEEAEGGTLFLDEIGEISPTIQLKLLRVLQERVVERVGGNASVPVDVRILCATHRELRELVEQGRFREDLFYRLNVIPLRAPALRERAGDIELLAHHFVRKAARANERVIESISVEALRLLEQHDWPGNVRELENALERAVVLSTDARIGCEHLPAELGAARVAQQELPEHVLDLSGLTLQQIERAAILNAYVASGGNTRDAADTLAISQRKVQYCLKSYRDEESAPERARHRPGGVGPKDEDAEHAPGER